MKEKQKKRYLQSYAWSAPSLVLIGLMVVFPILYTFYISLTNMNVYHWFDFTVVGDSRLHPNKTHIQFRPESRFPHDPGNCR